MVQDFPCTSLWPWALAAVSLVTKKFLDPAVCSRVFKMRNNCAKVPFCVLIEVPIKLLGKTGLKKKKEDG